jgi:hypothetical protein
LCQSFHHADRDNGWLRLAGDAEMLTSAGLREQFFADAATAHPLFDSDILSNGFHVSYNIQGKRRFWLDLSALFS